MVIRAARELDCDAVAAIYAPYVRETSISFELLPPSGADMRMRMREYSQFAPWLVAEDSGGIIGYAYGGPYRSRPAYGWTVETSVYVRQGCWGRGVGSALYKSLLACLTLQGFVTAIGGITLPNAESVKLHERFGFHKVAHLPAVGYKFGQWHDVGFWALHLRERMPHTPSVLRPDQLVALPAWSQAIASGAVPSPLAK